MNKVYVISVVSDVDSSSTYGPYSTEEAALDAIQNIPEYYIEDGDYCFNVHELSSPDTLFKDFPEEEAEAS